MRNVIVGDGEYQREEKIELKELTYDVGKEKRWHLGETEFDGHFVLWGFEYFPTTYLKSSGLSGDEWRKGGEIRYFKDRQLCYTEFCRDPLIAANKVGSTLLKLMDFPWDVLKVGQKVWYERTPAIVYMVLEDQGCALLKTEDGSKFPNAVWADGESALGEHEETIKVDILESHVYWYRT